ncbi:hypothetical protein BCR39DRAFT_537390 [Naematelia encephala]|uniref:Oxidoreductase n=1 Tax=Naematelia encephala TaxID=71784 RepID=A0A1Y2AZT3_9TREE|nr:hypothetical protein BCR39DRAFT_537390 [Naematelia encephala]
MGEQLKGKVCLITGAAGRIGRALVERFLVAGATVIAVDLSAPNAEGADNMKCDQGDPQSILELEEAIRKKYGRVDCVVNNGAVGGHRCSFHEKSLDEYEEVMRVNVRGPFLINQAVLRLHLKNTERPLSIVNMASTAGRIATSLASVYSMSKHALIGMTKNIAQEYATQNVRCNSLSPGYMEVPNVQGFSKEELAENISKSPLKRGGKPIEVANLALFLASDEASFITGADYLIDGGRTA